MREGASNVDRRMNEGGIDRKRGTERQNREMLTSGLEIRIPKPLKTDRICGETFRSQEEVSSWSIWTISAHL